MDTVIFNDPVITHDGNPGNPTIMLNPYICQSIKYFAKEYTIVYGSVQTLDRFQYFKSTLKHTLKVIT